MTAAAGRDANDDIEVNFGCVSVLCTSALAQVGTVGSVVLIWRPMLETPSRFSMVVA